MFGYQKGISYFLSKPKSRQTLGGCYMSQTQLVLENTLTTLEMTELGLRDLSSNNPKYQELGLRNIAMHGRSVTFTLQKLRSFESDFEDWYNDVQEEMKSSELCRFFKDLRNEIEKQGQVSTSVSAYISHFSTDMLQRLPKPENVKILGFFMGDKFGGSGWEIELPDGKKDKFYLDLPKEMIQTERFFNNPPNEHLGLSLEGMSIQEISKIYYEYLSELVSKAFDKFGK